EGPERETLWGLARDPGRGEWVRLAALCELADLHDRRAEGPLDDLLAGDERYEIQRTAAVARARVAGPGPALLRHPSPAVRRAALEYADGGDPGVRRAALGLLRDPDYAVKDAAAAALVRWGDAGVVLDSDDQRVRWFGALTWARSGPPASGD